MIEQDSLSLFGHTWQNSIHKMPVGKDIRDKRGN
jgi:hypothetical protein